MQNKTTLQTHNEILTANEPWHRGSGFTWMLLALAGLVIYLSGAAAKADTVTYTLGDTGQYSANFTDSANYFSNANSTELGMWANGGGAKEVVVWRDFKTAGDNTGSARSLQVGDTFTITVSATSAFGSIGFSLNDNGTQGSSFANRTSGSRLFVQEAGTGGSWEVNRSGGYTSLDYNVSSTRKDYKFEVAITSESTANVTLTEGANTKRAYNLSLNGTAGANIDAFSMWLSNDWNGSSNQNIYWKQNTTVENKGEVELGYYLASNATFTAGKITDGLAANSTSTTSANAVKVGGISGNTVYLASDNTYTGATTINADATAEAQHANALGSTSGGTTVTSGGALKLYDGSGISYAAESLTLNGVGVNAAGGALQNAGGNNTWNGVITAGSNTRIQATSGSLNITGGITGGSNVLYVGTEGGAITIGSGISGVGASQNGTITSLYKDGAGTLTLSGSNDYSGDTRITTGTLTVSSGGNLGNGDSDIFISSGATLNVNTSLTVDSVRETGMDNGGVIALGSGATLTIDGASKGVFFQNSISGEGGLTMAGSGDTTLGLYGTQSYTGATTVTGGKLTTSVALASTSLTVNGGTLETTADGVIANNASTTLSSGTFSIGGNDTIGSVTATGGRLSVASGKTASLSGNSSIGAGAEIVGGTIQANTGTTLTVNSLDVDNTSALSIASGGTLTGTFRTSGELSVDGVLAPGNSTGISYAGATTFLGGGRYQWEIDTFGPGAVVGTNWDFLDISGALTISASSGDKFWIDIVSLLASTDTAGAATGFNLTSNYSFAIATAAGGISGFDAGAFGINTDGFQNSMGASPAYAPGVWSVSTSGNSLMLNYAGATAIPEPNSAALVLVGLGAALLKRRRRG